MILKDKVNNASLYPFVLYRKSNTKSIHSAEPVVSKAL